MGFSLPARITAAAVRSYRTFSPLPGGDVETTPGGIVFCGTIRKIHFMRIPPAVSRHAALWRPDFPPAPRAFRPGKRAPARPPGPNPYWQKRVAFVIDLSGII